MASARRALATLALPLGCLTPGSPEPQPAEQDGPIRGGDTFLQPNVKLPDGRPGYVHPAPADMPWRVAVGMPREPPAYGSRRRAREAAIEAMRMWERALQPHLPWFRLEFVESDPSAAVQVEWKRRVPGTWAGFGRITWAKRGEEFRVGGEMQVSTTPDPRTTLTLGEVRRLVAHEFGHVLGLGHCLDCDSAMNYAWHTRERVMVTDLDVRTFLALVAKPNGSPAPTRPE